MRSVLQRELLSAFLSTSPYVCACMLLSPFCCCVWDPKTLPSKQFQAETSDHQWTHPRNLTWGHKWRPFMPASWKFPFRWKDKDVTFSLEPKCFSHCLRLTKWQHVLLTYLTNRKVAAESSETMCVEEQIPGMRQASVPIGEQALEQMSQISSNPEHAVQFFFFFF